MPLNVGKPFRTWRGLVPLVLTLVFAALTGTLNAQTSMEKYRAARANSPFNLSSGATGRLQANLVDCGINNIGEVCANVFDSPTGGGGFWPSGTTNQYIFNSGLQIAGINSAAAGPWAGDTVGAYFFDARGQQKHGSQLSDVFDSLNPDDISKWPDGAYASDTTLFSRTLLGTSCPATITSCPKAVSDQDTWVRYWDGNPNKISRREHTMGIMVEQRSMAFNAPAGAENTVFFIYKFTNVTHCDGTAKPGCPTIQGGGILDFQHPNESTFNVNLPDAGWRVDSLYAAFGMDCDVTTHASDNFSTASLPVNMGLCYKADFSTDDFDFGSHAELYNPPFFRGVGFVGVAYLRSPINPATGQQVGLTMYSNTTNSSVFPDPSGVNQLFRYLKGDVKAAAGDPVCTIPNGIQRHLCALVQTADDARFYQASGPFSLNPGQSATIVVAYTHGPPIKVPDYAAAPGKRLLPGIPSRFPGLLGDTLRTVDKMIGLAPLTSSMLTITGNDTTVNTGLLKYTPRSLVANALVGLQIFSKGFLAPAPPAAPPFTLVPGDNKVTVVWEPSPTEKTGDPYYTVAQSINPATGRPIDANYRQFDVEGYRVYRAVGLRGGFCQIAQFDYAGTTIRDITGQFDPNFVPEEGTGVYPTPKTIPLTGDLIQYPAGGRVRTASGDVLVFKADTLSRAPVGDPNQCPENGPQHVTLTDAGVPFIFVDHNVKNGLTYRYMVTAFDVNSQASSSTLESPRLTQFVVPRSSGQDITAADATIQLRGATKALDPAAPLPTIDAQGKFSGPQPPTNGFKPGELALALGNAVKAGQTVVARIDSVIPGTYTATYFLSLGDGNKTIATCSEFANVRASGSCGKNGAPILNGNVTLPADTTAVAGLFQNTPKFSGQATFSLSVGHPQFASGVADFAANAPQFWNPAPDAAAADGGSRWFEGANETLADPTLGLKWGQLTGISKIYSPQPFADPAVSATGRRWYQAMFNIMRAADVQVTWTGGQVTKVQDVTHDVAVPFKAKPQAGYGFLPDGNGDGVISFTDTRRLEFEDAFGGWSQTPKVGLVAQPVVMNVDVTGDNVSDGTGFALVIDGETYFFLGAPPTTATWTLRSYAGQVKKAGTGYTFTSDDIRMPAIPGLQISLNVNSPALLTVSNDLSRVHTVPDPYYVRSQFELGPANKELRFVNVPQQSIIRIYTVNGTLVRVLEHNDPIGGGEVAWDLRNRNQQFVASGVYFYVVEAPNGHRKTGRMTVIQFAQ